VQRDDDGAIEAHLLGVVLADVGVIPVDARIGEAHLVAEAAALGNRRLHAVVRMSMRHAIELVIEPEPMPVYRRLQVSLVGEVHCDL
jgi:hypothetical protein